MEQVTIGLAVEAEVLGTLALGEMVVTEVEAEVATLPDQVVQEALEELA
jgi:hypothetical protein